MNIHYTKEFEKPLVEGTKIHTIRKFKIEKGVKLKHVVYPYTKNKRRIVLENECAGNQTFRYEVNSDYLNEDKIFIDGNEIISIEDKQQIAYNDGFYCLAAFNLYFRKEGNYNVDLFINHWTENRY